MRSIQDYLNESYVNINTDAYKTEYKKFPRGRGNWFFKIGKEEFHFSGDYSEAAKKAKEKAKAMGIYNISAMI